MRRETNYIQIHFPIKEYKLFSFLQKTEDFDRKPLPFTRIFAPHTAPHGPNVETA